MYLSRNKKNNISPPPCKPQCYYKKVGFKGVKLYKYVFVMQNCFSSNMQKGYTLKENNLKSVDLFSNGGCGAGKQTGSHKSCRPWNNWRKICPVYSVIWRFFFCMTLLCFLLFSSQKISKCSPLTLRKHAYSNKFKILQPRKENFQIKKLWYYCYFFSKHGVPKIYLFSKLEKK